ILKGVCHNCGRIKIDPKRIPLYTKRALFLKEKMPDRYKKFIKKVIKEAYSVDLCPFCGAPNVKIIWEKPHKFYKEVSGTQVELSPADIRDLFERIPDEDLILYGLNKDAARPEWLILTVLPVPPLTIRPSIQLETGERSEDDLTHKLADIVRISNKIKRDKMAGSVSMALKNDYDALQLHVITYLNNELPGIPPATHRGTRRLRTLAQRLTGKEGRFRGNLVGKRVNFSARSVISPDSNLHINEVGIPIEIAKKLTVRTIVTPFNIERLRRYILNGPEIHPGANYVIKTRKGGIRLYLKYANRKFVADTLEVGDIVERHLDNGDIVLFNRQPSLHRMSIMAHIVRVLPYRTFRLHLSVCPPYNADFDGDEMNVHVLQNSEAIAEAISLMLVQNQIISPRYGAPIIGMSKDHLTSSFLLSMDNNISPELFYSLLSMLSDYKRTDLLKDLGKIERSGRILISLLLPKTFTYSLKSRTDEDVIIKEGLLIKGIIDKKSIGVEEADTVLHRLVREYGNEYGGWFITNLVRILDSYLSRKGFSMGASDLILPKETQAEINKIIEEAKKKVDELIERYRSGKLEPIRGLTLEESLEYRVHEVLADARTRAGKIAMEALGKRNPLYIMTISGARGQELNIAQLTALLGQQTIRGKRIMRGYGTRTLTTFKENDIGAEARGFISSSFIKGLTPVEFFFHTMAGREGLMDTAVKTQQSGYLYRRLVYSLDHLKVDYDLAVRTSDDKIVQFIYGEDGVDPARSDHGKPINVQRLVESIMLLYPTGEKATEEYIDTLLNKVRDQIPLSLFNELRETLIKKGVNKKVAKECIRQSIINYKKAKVDPGTPVGTIAAQSIGEPATQMTLRTFHFAGVKEKDVTIGLPRVIEVIDAKRSPSTPRMIIRLKKEYRKSQEIAEKVANKIKCTLLKDVVTESTIDIVNRCIIYKMDLEAIKKAGTTIEKIKKLFSRRYSVEIRDNYLVIRLPNKDVEKLKTLNNKFLNKHIAGVSGIVRVTVEKVYDPTIDEEEWVIYTAGSNLKEVLTIEEVDPTRTITNDIYEIYRVLGIEAARTAIINEIKSVMDEQGLDVDYRHIMLVADAMTRDGTIKGAGRQGIVASRSSVLARSAFEITIPVLAEAAVSGEKDKLKGPTENIIVGTRVPIGTGAIDIYMDMGVVTNNIDGEYESETR
ncbi:MAG: DNA-directed RNA polymerase subunit A', partial [Candidatus Geothermarchaeota archaeon]